jgi:hypothetical protein
LERIMTPLDGLAILALTVFAIYRQTRTSEVTEQSRFKLAIIYAVVGIVVGGFAIPHGVAAYGLLAASLLLSAIVGLARGRLTRVWRVPDGRAFTRGTALTIGLFVALIVMKFGLGAIAYLTHIHDGEGFGEVLVMIAIMVAVQAEIVWRRAQALRPSHDSLATTAV